MEYLTSTPAVLGMILTAVLLGLLKDEVAAWLPSLTDKVVRIAARRVPKEMRERYEEEWNAHVQSYPGKVSQLFQALLCLRASSELAEASKLKRLQNAAFASAGFSLVLMMLGLYFVLYRISPSTFREGVVLAILMLAGLSVQLHCAFRYVREVRRIRMKRLD